MQRPRWLDFYWLWIKTAFPGAWAILAVGSTLATFLPPLARRAMPSLAPLLDSLIWQVPIALAGTVALVRLVLAPFWIWSEQRALLDTKRDQGQIVNDLSALLYDGNALFQARPETFPIYDAWRVRYEDWLARVNGFLAEKRGNADVAFFTGAPTGQEEAKYFPLYYPPMNKDLNNLREYLRVLKEILARADAGK